MVKCVLEQSWLYMMILPTCAVLLTFLLAGVSCSNDVVVGDLPSDVVAELAKILLGILTLDGECSPPQLEEASFLLYTRSNPNDPIILNRSNPIEVDRTKKVVVAIHGYLSSPYIYGMPDIKNGYIDLYDCNVIMIDWSELASYPYTTAYCGIPAIAQLVADFLCRLSIPLNTTHLVGHSMGAQMSGLVGALTKTMCGQELGRISGLDPAKPIYQTDSPDKRLDSSDAIIVDVVHTNEMQSGYEGNCGDVDFHVNCGYVQPGCPAIALLQLNSTLVSVFACSHLKAIYYWVESLHTDQFKGRSCPNCPKDCFADISDASCITMGERCPSNPPKKVYKVPVNITPPYAKGAAGLCY